MDFGIRRMIRERDFSDSSTLLFQTIIELCPDDESRKNCSSSERGIALGNAPVPDRRTAGPDASENHARRSPKARRVCTQCFIRATLLPNSGTKASRRYIGSRRLASHYYQNSPSISLLSFFLSDNYPPSSPLTSLLNMTKTNASRGEKAAPPLVSW